MSIEDIEELVILEATHEEYVTIAAEAELTFED